MTLIRAWFRGVSLDTWFPRLVILPQSELLRIRHADLGGCIVEVHGGGDSFLTTLDELERIERGELITGPEMGEHLTVRSGPHAR